MMFLSGHLSRPVPTHRCELRQHCPTDAKGKHQQVMFSHNDESDLLCSFVFVFSYNQIVSAGLELWLAFLTFQLHT